MFKMFKKKTYRIWDAVPLVFRMVPRAGILKLLQYVIQGLQSSLLILATASFIDTALDVVQKTAVSADLVGPIIAVIVAIFLPMITSPVIDWLILPCNQQRTLLSNLAVIDKVSQMQYRLVEDQETADLTDRISNDLSSSVWDSYLLILRTMSLIISIVGVLAVLAKYVWWAALIMIAVCVPFLMIARKSGKAQYDFQRENEKYWRHNAALAEMLSSREAVEERTLFGYSDKIGDLWYDSARQLMRRNRKVSFYWWIRSQTGVLFSIVTGGLLTALLLRQAVHGGITIGVFTSLSGACFDLANMFGWRLAGILEEYSNKSEFFKDLTVFTALEETPGGADDLAETLPDFETLEFRDVSFTYPGTEQPILQHVSFRMERGHHYSIVGTNGAGKSTIVKLICGLYDNYEGEILLNGQELQTIPYAIRKGLFSVVSQDYPRYQLTLAENIRLGDCSLSDTDPKIAEAAEKAGLSDVIARLPLGLAHPLGKLEENGQDLSGGEWQRVAMARTLVSRAPFYILDEPTAALDPIAESKMYSQYADLSRNKTTIFISHRLGSTRLADEILVLDHGTIAESGSYQELMQAQGLYAEMFDAQRSWYV